MNTLKKNFPLILAFLLGAVITYLAMSLMQVRREMDELRGQIVQSKDKDREQVEKSSAKEKHWMDEMIEKRSAETEQRIKDQQAEGDDFKNQFEQFIE